MVRWLHIFKDFKFPPEIVSFRIHQLKKFPLPIINPKHHIKPKTLSSLRSCSSIPSSKLECASLERIAPTDSFIAQLNPAPTQISQSEEKESISGSLAKSLPRLDTAASRGNRKSFLRAEGDMEKLSQFSN